MSNISENLNENLSDPSAAPRPPEAGASELPGQSPDTDNNTDNDAGHYPEQHLEVPVRPLDWRFACVQSLLAPQSGRRTGSTGSTRPTGLDDEYVAALYRFLRRYRPSPPAARRRLGLQYPGPFGAIQIREQIPCELQLEVQCRILSGQDDAGLARKTGLPPLAIGWYEKLFFNVRENLHVPGWVRANVLGPAALQNLSPQESTWKTLAYTGGLVLFESVQSAPAPAVDPESPVKLEDFLEDTVLARIRRQAVLSVEAPGQKSAQELITLVRQLQSLAAAKAALQGDQSEHEEIFTNAMRHTLGCINFIKGDMAAEYLQKHCPDLLEFDNCAAELRDQQIYAVVSGNTDKVAHMKDIKFPQPPRHRHDAPPVPMKGDPLEGC